MKKLILLIIILTLSLSGCGDWVTPDDYSKFIATVEKLDTPQKIGDYMLENFTYETNSILLDPYQLFLIKKGNCDDFSNFAIFIANYHNYITYLIIVFFEGTFKAHALAIYLENGKYTYSSNKEYRPIYASSFKEIISDYFTYFINHKLELENYIVYDDWDDVFKQVTK